MTEANDQNPAPERDWSKIAPNVKRRHCPGCKAPLIRFHLQALLLPIEQFTVGRLQQTNHAMDWSVRPFGSQSAAELQQLTFMSACAECSLVSTWDFSTKELDEVLRYGGAIPYAQIAWNYHPDAIETHLSKAPDWLKPHLQNLLHIVRTKRNDET